jgi:hypothetical protein
MSFKMHRVAMVALLMGSAILLFSCKEETGPEQPLDAVKTEEGTNLTIRMSENGRKSYVFSTPLLEGYALARDPYREFCKGIEITTFQDDSLSTRNINLVANYAIYYEKRKLWEARGDVVVTKEGGNRRLYTQQLFWNSVTKRIYSNVDTKLVTWWYNEKGELIVEHLLGEQGFESDEELNEPRLHGCKARMYVNPDKIQEDDDFGDDEQSEQTEKKESAQQVVTKTKEAESIKPVQKTETKKSTSGNKGANATSKRVNRPKTTSSRPNNPFTKPAPSNAGGNQAPQKRSITAPSSQKKK